METEVIRAFLGAIALLCAGSQLVLRYYIASTYGADQPAAATQRLSTSIAAALILVGVGLGNLTHLNVEPTISTLVITIGLGAVVHNQYDLWREAVERTPPHP